MWKQALGSLRGGALIQEVRQEGRVGRTVNLLSVTRGRASTLLEPQATVTEREA